MKNILLFGKSNLLFKGLTPLINKEPHLNVHSICTNKKQLFTTLTRHNINALILSHDKEDYLTLLPSLEAFFPQLLVINLSNETASVVKHKLLSTKLKGVFAHQNPTLEELIDWLK